jgi:hypothetical protein
MRVVLSICVALLWTMMASAEVPDSSWKMDSRRERNGVEWAVYVEAERSPGTPAFRIETSFDVIPLVAARTLMAEMVEPSGTTKGQERRLIERTERGALVHTFVDLPFMFSDRELAIQIRHTDDLETGVHRIDWADANEVLPPVGKGVLRLETEGYWEFRPDGANRTSATYMSRAEVGGSLPDTLSNRLMKTQAIDSVKRLQAMLEKHRTLHVAAPPPARTASE